MAVCQNLRYLFWMISTLAAFWILGFDPWPYPSIKLPVPTTYWGHTKRHKPKPTPLAFLCSDQVAMAQKYHVPIFYAIGKGKNGPIPLWSPGWGFLFEPNLELKKRSTSGLLFFEPNSSIEAFFKKSPAVPRTTYDAWTTAISRGAQYGRLFGGEATRNWRACLGRTILINPLWLSTLDIFRYL